LKGRGASFVALHDFMKRVWNSAGLALVAAFGWSVFSAETRAAPPVDFKRDILPIFEGRCYECHGPQKDKGGLRFDKRSTVFGGSDSGKPVIVPGQSGASPLFQHVTSMDPDTRMPPKGERLSEAQIAALKSWIDAGADWPESATPEKQHWAYVHPGFPTPPAVKAAQGLRNAIDHFVLARLEKEKLKPSPEADRAVLLRRVSLDLTGLPPTLDEVEAFLVDKSPEAYERAVNRLLASPAYGERWARPWLDLARYADTQGYEKDNRRTMWPYRDWVIQALNDNLRFDQFTIEQLAGDLLPDATQEQKVATGFHRNTMTNTEGGTDNEEFRYEAVVDRINTTFATWLGTTFNCAQCHNHKYDPFSTVEYYRIMAFLNHTADADADDERPTMKVFKPGQKEQLKELRDAEQAAGKELNDAVSTPLFAQAQVEWETKIAREHTAWETLDPTEFKSEGGATLRKNNTKSIVAEGVNPTNDTYVVTAAAGAGRVTGIRLEALETGPEKALGRHANGGFVLRQFDLSVKPGGADSDRPARWKSVSANFSQKDFDVTNLLTGKGDGWAVATFEEKNRVRRSAYFALAEPLDLPEGGTLTFTLRHSHKHPGANLRRFRLYATRSEEVGPPTKLPDDVRAVLAVTPDQRDEKQRDKLRDYFKSIAPALKPQREALAAAKKAADEFDAKIPVTSVMVELDKPRETHRHVRGAYLTKAEVVTPGTPASLHSFAPFLPTNRLGFARWLVDTNNPLTARVIMNRFWEQYFGRGIVETVEEFGKQGEPPSHPELLDWLAAEFMRTGWDLKAMHKTIVMSATYRQTSKVSPELLERDPNNRLLARGPRVRLEAEMLRDQMLAVSGLLSRKMGGPSVMPPQPDGVWQVVYSGDKWETSKGEDKYRRGLYTFWRRTAPHPAMVSFDAPSREFCVLRRNRSNTPLQALTTLNDPAAIEAAQAIARRVAAFPGTDARARAALAFRLVLARAPQPKEVDRLVALFQSELAAFKQDSTAAGKMAFGETSQPPAEADAAELAAWTVVANVLLNLDETITKG
jgi:mono/diheme cytochrome c family protein